MTWNFIRELATVFRNKQSRRAGFSAGTKKAELMVFLVTRYSTKLGVLYRLGSSLQGRVGCIRFYLFGKLRSIYRGGFFVLLACNWVRESTNWVGERKTGTGNREKVELCFNSHARSSLLPPVKVACLLQPEEF